MSQVLDPLRRAVGSDPRGLKGGNGRVGFISSAIVQRCMMWLGGRVDLRLAVVRPEEKNISIASHQGRCCFTMRALPVCQSVAVSLQPVLFSEDGSSFEFLFPQLFGLKNDTYRPPFCCCHRLLCEFIVSSYESVCG